MKYSKVVPGPTIYKILSFISTLIIGILSFNATPFPHFELLLLARYS